MGKVQEKLKNVPTLLMNGPSELICCPFQKRAQGLRPLHRPPDLRRADRLLPQLSHHRHAGTANEPTIREETGFGFGREYFHMY